MWRWNILEARAQPCSPCPWAAQQHMEVGNTQSPAGWPSVTRQGDNSAIKMPTTAGAGQVRWHAGAGNSIPGSHMVVVEPSLLAHRGCMSRKLDGKQSSWDWKQASQAALHSCPPPLVFKAQSHRGSGRSQGSCGNGQIPYNLNFQHLLGWLVFICKLIHTKF